MSGLSNYNDSFAPQRRGTFRPGLEAVADGEHDFTIHSAELAVTPRTQDDILRTTLRVDATGQVLEYTYFINSQRNVDWLGGDLAVLGFDVARWTTALGRPFDRELPGAVAQLPGRRFRGRKSTNRDKNDPTRVYHNLDILERLEDDPGRGERAAGDLIPF